MAFALAVPVLEAILPSIGYAVTGTGSLYAGSRLLAGGIYMGSELIDSINKYVSNRDNFYTTVNGIEYSQEAVNFAPVDNSATVLPSSVASITNTNFFENSFHQNAQSLIQVGEINRTLASIDGTMQVLAKNFEISQKNNVSVFDRLTQNVGLISAGFALLHDLGVINTGVSELGKVASNTGSKELDIFQKNELLKQEARARAKHKREAIEEAKLQSKVKELSTAKTKIKTGESDYYKNMSEASKQFKNNNPKDSNTLLKIAGAVGLLATSAELDKFKPKIEVKPAPPKVEVKATPKVEVKTVPRVEVKAEPKVEIQSDFSSLVEVLPTKNDLFSIFGQRLTDISSSIVAGNDIQIGTLDVLNALFGPNSAFIGNWAPFNKVLNYLHGDTYRPSLSGLSKVSRSEARTPLAQFFSGFGSLGVIAKDIANYDPNKEKEEEDDDLFPSISEFIFPKASRGKDNPVVKEGWKDLPDDF